MQRETADPGKKPLFPLYFVSLMVYYRKTIQGIFIMNEQWCNKKVAFIGDSITDKIHVGTTRNYWDYLAESCGIIPLVYGINGSQWNGVPRKSIRHGEI